MPKRSFARLEEKYRRSKKDTGSPAVQVIRISARIQEIAEHLKEHRKDHDARLGLLKLLAKRRRLLSYLSKFEPNVYRRLVKDLDLKA